MHDIQRPATTRGAAARVRAAVAGLLLLLALPGGVVAHAELVTSIPADGETLTTGPAEAVLTFSERLGARSTVDVVDSRGLTVATSGPDPSEATVMRVALPPLTPGSYEVRWTTVADDGHIERGTFEFAVAEPTAPPATPATVPTDAPTAAPTATDAATPAPAATRAAGADDQPEIGSGTENEMDVLLPILAVVVLVGAGLPVVLRRRSPG